MNAAIGLSSTSLPDSNALIVSAKSMAPTVSSIAGPRYSQRRFQIALHMPRPNFRAIHFPRPRIGWRTVSFILLIILGASISLAFIRPEFRAGQVQVTGSQMLTPDEINAVMNVAGQPIFLLIPSDLEDRKSTRLNSSHRT